MTHPDDLLASAVSGSMTRDERANLDEHLAGCPACQRMVTDLREDAASVHAAFALLAPIGLPSASSPE